MSQFQILGRRPLPFKAIPIRFAYTNFPDTIVPPDQPRAQARRHRRRREAGALRHAQAGAADEVERVQAHRAPLQQAEETLSDRLNTPCDLKQDVA